MAHRPLTGRNLHMLPRAIGSFGGSTMWSPLFLSLMPNCARTLRLNVARSVCRCTQDLLPPPVLEALVASWAFTTCSERRAAVIYKY